MSEDQSAVRQLAIGLMRSALAQLADQGDLVIPRTEAQIHRAVDLLRNSRADTALLRTAEFVSCGMMEMSHFLRQGRVNAYASKLIRVRKACNSL